MSNYRNISNVGSNSQYDVNDPLTYCMSNDLSNGFLHGSQADVIGKHSRECQLYMSQYCADNWDQFCEVASLDNTKNKPDMYMSCANGTAASPMLDLTAGQLLIHNTAARKYLVEMYGGKQKFVPFDPTVANSPMISYWVGEGDSYSSGIPAYAVDPNQIDNDVVMDKLLEEPKIGFNILINIYNTMKRKGTLSKLRNTKLGDFYNKCPYFKNKGGVN